MPKVHCLLGLTIILGAIVSTASGAKDKYFGGATDSKLLKTDTKYQEHVKKYFQILTPGNELKWGVFESVQGKVDFSGADALKAFAEKNGKKIRAHTLLANTQNPSWIGSLSKDDIKKLAFARLETIFQRYGKNMISFDVCNEIIDDNGGALRQTIWLQKWGQGFVEDIYRKARELGKKYNPAVKLFINDYSIEDQNPKSNFMLQLATSLNKKGILDAVGFQSHFVVGQIPKGFKQNLERFTEAGLFVAISELDIRIKLQGRSQQDIQKDRDQQTKDFETVFKVCSSLNKCLGVTAWGITDKDSWIPTNPGTVGFGEAVLFDKNYNAKPAVKVLDAYIASSTPKSEF